MSKLTAAWVYPDVREFPLPYVKRAFMTDKTGAELTRLDGWSEWVCDRIDMQQKVLTPVQKLCVQIMQFGGPAAWFRANPDRQYSSHSFRSAFTLCAVLDCFHEPTDRAFDVANDWHNINDAAINAQYPDSTTASAADKAKYNGAVLPVVRGLFCDADRRVWWGSFESNLNRNVVSNYYEQAMYEFVMRVKAREDPNGLFDANEHCITGMQRDASSASWNDAGVRFRGLSKPPTDLTGAASAAAGFGLGGFGHTLMMLGAPAPLLAGAAEVATAVRSSLRLCPSATKRG
jgi:hypothetical protein